MVNLSNILAIDPTLAAADIALEEKAFNEPRRASRLGMGQIGDNCHRRTWYRFRLALREKFSAKTLKAFHDGHACEQTQADRLRLVSGISLQTIDEKTGLQFEYTDCNGHFVGKVDGKITGLLQAPKKLHIWEHKSNEKKFNEFKKIKADIGEKNVLRKWNFQYWCQAILYMFYEGTDRHYMTVSTPGARDVESCRTDGDEPYAIQLKNRAQKIINSDTPPEKIGNADYFECRGCNLKGICHEGDAPDRTCRTCLHSTAIEMGQWHCERFGKTLTSEEQIAGCAAHLYLPGLVDGKIVGSTDASVTYELANGSVWTDSEYGDC